MGFISTNCPGCGSPIELDDSREFGFCQFCGTKIVQDKIVVEHKGEVKIDNSELVEKYLQNANRALRKHDWEEVEKYYNLIEQNTFNNMEAAFFSSYGKAMLALSDSDFHKREQKFDVLKRSMSVISDYYDETTEDKEAVLKKINEYIKVMYTIDSVNNYNKEGTTLTGSLVDGLFSSPGSLRWHIALLNGVKVAFLTELNQIHEKHDDAFIQELINEYTGQGNNTQEKSIPEKATPEEKPQSNIQAPDLSKYKDGAKGFFAGYKDFKSLSLKQKILHIAIPLIFFIIVFSMFGGSSDSKYISAAKNAYLDLNAYGSLAQWSEEEVVAKDDYGRAIVVMRLEIPEYNIDGYQSAVVYKHDGSWGYYYNGFKTLSGKNDESKIREIKNSSYWNSPDF